MAHILHIPHSRRRGLSLPRLADLLALHRQRRALARLDASRLDDLGLSRDEALREADKPIWDVPAHWSR
ncbi:DUF1127 domain-containing protein [Marinovum sp.]|uniref:DUF1127 domain-containing protein n=1 Tax=Marinovum sp. TaxID=2024839 RepID=UPI003A932E7E